jgi:hypothetical protein
MIRTNPSLSRLKHRLDQEHEREQREIAESLGIPYERREPTNRLIIREERGHDSDPAMVIMYVFFALLILVLGICWAIFEYLF